MYCNYSNPLLKIMALSCHKIALFCLFSPMKNSSSIRRSARPFRRSTYPINQIKKGMHAICAFPHYVRKVNLR